MLRFLLTIDKCFIFSCNLNMQKLKKMLNDLLVEHLYQALE